MRLLILVSHTSTDALAPTATPAPPPRSPPTYGETFYSDSAGMQLCLQLINSVSCRYELHTSGITVVCSLQLTNTGGLLFGLLIVAYTHTCLYTQAQMPVPYRRPRHPPPSYGCEVHLVVKWHLTNAWLHRLCVDAGMLACVPRMPSTTPPSAMQQSRQDMST